MDRQQSDFKYPIKSPHPRGCFRVVKNGKVRIRHRDFAPNHGNEKEYDGRLEGMELFFMPYWRQNEAGLWDILSFIAFWGTAERARDLENIDDYEEPHIIDGIVHWYFWDQIES
jgi:hypothetical protein